LYLFISALFIDNLITVAKRELAWEVDYERESECTKKFQELLAPYPEYYIPHVIGMSL
jgi:aarF domain-containing kinase